eukprot:7030730-Ditylum_brightwellii.AAC.1
MPGTQEAFHPMVFSADGMPREEAIAAMKRMAPHLAAKMDREYSEMCGYVRERMALAIVHTNTLILRDARDGGSRLRYQPSFEDGEGLSQQQPWRE